MTAIRRALRDVVEVHRERVVELVAELECSCRSRRRDQDVDLFKGGVEVALDERAHLLRLPVVGVVVARREGVRAEHDATDRLRAEARRARARHDLLDAGAAVVLADPHAETHTVELREVARALAREDDVVRRQRVGEVRCGHLDDLGTELGEKGDRLVKALPHSGLVALATELLDDTDAHARDVTATRGCDDVGHGDVEGGRVERVVTRDDRVEQCGVEHRAGARPGLVERGRQRDEAIAGDGAVRRLHSDGARDGCGLADRTAGVRADGKRCLEGRHRGCRATARTPGDALEVPRVVGGAVGRVLGGGAHGELVHVGLAEDHDARLLEARGDGRVVRRTPALEDP